MKMKDLMEIMDIKDWLSLNAQLQAKKNTVRRVLKEKGVLPKQGNNTYDHYKYFSEAQYKELFTGLFADCGLELKFDEVAYDTFTGTEKQANGRMPKLEFYLFDMKTGFFETTCITGEGIDKGDKAGYKAYTGALKYYLANTFMVATGDDPEKDSPNLRMNKKEDVRSRKNEEPTAAVSLEDFIDEKTYRAFEKHIKSLGFSPRAVLDEYQIENPNKITWGALHIMKADLEERAKANKAKES